MEKPFGIKIIAGFYLFGAVILFISLFSSSSSISSYGIGFIHGITFIHELPMRIMVVVFTFVLSYGYAKQTKWGFYAMVIYTAYFSIISSHLAFKLQVQPFIGNMIWSLLILIYTVMNRSCFQRTN